MAKTIREWLSELENESDRFFAIEHCKEQRGEKWLDMEVDRLSQAIDAAFSWSNTPEGGQYWADLHDKTCEAEREVVEKQTQEDELKEQSN